MGYSEYFNYAQGSDSRTHTNSLYCYKYSYTDYTDYDNNCWRIGYSDNSHYNHVIYINNIDDCAIHYSYSNHKSYSITSGALAQTDFNWTYWDDDDNGSVKVLDSEKVGYNLGDMLEEVQTNLNTLISQKGDGVTLAASALTFDDDELATAYKVKNLGAQFNDLLGQLGNPTLINEAKEENANKIDKQELEGLASAVSELRTKDITAWHAYTNTFSGTNATHASHSNHVNYSNG